MIEYHPLFIIIMHFICSLVYVYIWFIQYQLCKNRCTMFMFSFGPFLYMCIFVFGAKPPFVKHSYFRIKLNRHHCVLEYTHTHTIRVEARLNIYQDICDESINLVQLPFGNHPDTKQFFALHISYILNTLFR